MPGTAAPPEIEIIVEDVGGGAPPPPPPGGGDDGGDDGDGGEGRHKWSPPPKRYSTAIAIGLVSILMFFMALASAFIVLRAGSDKWVVVHLPRILWVNTCVLLASSFTLESARRRLALADVAGFRK
jgi:cytochrome c oxidase subunit 3